MLVRIAWAANNLDESCVGHVANSEWIFTDQIIPRIVVRGSIK